MTRSHLRSHHGRLNREGSAAAEGINQDAVGLPGRQHDQRCCQRFRDRRLADELAVAALVKGHAAGIQTNCYDILHQRIRAAGYCAPHSGNQLTLYFCFRRSTIAFFIIDWISDGLNSLLLMEAAFANPELAIRRDEFLPGKRLRALKEVVKGLRAEASHLQQDSLRRAQEDIRTAGCLRATAKGYFTVFYMNDLVAEIRQFLSYIPPPCQSGREQSIRIRTYFLRLFFEPRWLLNCYHIAYITVRLSVNGDLRKGGENTFASRTSTCLYAIKAADFTLTHFRWRTLMEDIGILPRRQPLCIRIL